MSDRDGSGSESGLGSDLVRLARLVGSMRAAQRDCRGLTSGARLEECRVLEARVDRGVAWVLRRGGPPEQGRLPLGGGGGRGPYGRGE